MYYYLLILYIVPIVQIKYYRIIAYNKDMDGRYLYLNT